MTQTGISLRKDYAPTRPRSDAKLIKRDRAQALAAYRQAEDSMDCTSQRALLTAFIRFRF